MKRNGNGKTQEDQRPDPKPRKRANLWQAYLFWDELVQMRKRHNLRISSIEAGKSNLDAMMEQEFISAMGLDKAIDNAKKTMVAFGEASAPEVWQWMTSIRGLGEGGLAAQVIAQVDDITSFTNVSKLWRFAGYAVIDGRREHNTAGKKAHFNKRLKSVCYLIADQFIKQQTPLYVDLYYAEKERLRELYPEPVKSQSGNPWPYMFTDNHVHRMAMGKSIKIFLQHLWLVWREAEGLPTNEPYVIAILKHADYVEPFSA